MPEKNKGNDPYVSIATADPYASIVTDVDPFKATKENKEGVYNMQTPDGQIVSVPYSKVMSASKAGYLISPDDRLTYGKDKLAELTGKGQKGSFNPDTDLPHSYTEIGAGGAPWYKSVKGWERAGLDLLPTAGGVVGGIIGGGGGLETGPGAIATGAAGAAAGGGLGETVRESLTEKLFPFEHRMTPKESAEHIVGQGALQGASEAGGRVATKAMQPLARYLERTALASSKAGVPLLPSEAAGKAPSYVEKFLKGSVLTSGKMDKFREAQNQQTKAAVEKIADNISKYAGSPEELGKKVQEGIAAHEKQFRAVQNQMYADIGKQVNERVVKIPVTTTSQVPTGLLDQYGKPTFTTSTVTKLADKTVDDVMPSTKALKIFAAQELKKLDQVEQILDPNLLGSSRSMLNNILDAPDNITYNAMRTARSDTLAKVRELDQALAGKQAGLAKKMADLFDTSIMDAVKKSKIPGLEQQVRAADAFTANEHRMFEQALVKKIVDTKKPEAIATLIRGKAIGNEETRDLFKILPKSLHAPVQRQIVLDSMRQSMNNVSKAFNERKFAELIGGIGDERGQIIFGSNWKNIKELTGIMERINGPVGLQGGAGAALQNFAILKNAMLLAIPGGEALRGEWLGSVGSLAGEWASLNAIASAMIHPDKAALMLKAAQQVVKHVPYATTTLGYEAIDLGRKHEGKPPSLMEQAEERGRQLKEQYAKPSAQPLPYTHTYDEKSGQIVPVQ